LDNLHQIDAIPLEMFRFDELFEFVSPFDYGIFDDLDREVVDASRCHLYCGQWKF